MKEITKKYYVKKIEKLEEEQKNASKEMIIGGIITLISVSLGLLTIVICDYAWYHTNKKDLVKTIFAVLEFVYGVAIVYGMTNVFTGDNKYNHKAEKIEDLTFQYNKERLETTKLDKEILKEINSDMESVISDSLIKIDLDGYDAKQQEKAKELKKN